MEEKEAGTQAPLVSLRKAWRDAAWTAHEGEGLDLDATADAAVRVVLEHLLLLEPISGLDESDRPLPGFRTQHAIATLLSQLPHLEQEAER